MEAPFKNRFVLDRESGQPGHDHTVAYATREDLAELARRLSLVAQDLSGELSEYATRMHGQSSRVMLQFRCTDQRSIDEFHRTTPHWGATVWILDFLGAAALLGLAAFGCRSLLS